MTLVTTCIPCQHGNHDQCGKGMSAPITGLIGSGSSCPCKGECRGPGSGTLERTVVVYACPTRACPAFLGIDGENTADGSHGDDPHGWPHCPTHGLPMRPVRVEEVRPVPTDHPAGCFYGSFGGYDDNWHIPAEAQCGLDHGERPIQLERKEADRG